MRIGQSIPQYRFYQAQGQPKANQSIFVDEKVDRQFATNVISQYKKLCQQTGGAQAKKLVILSEANDIKDIAQNYQQLAGYLDGDAKIAYGVYARKDDTICIIQNNHKRKVEEYEGDLNAQGSDTLTHEFAHLLDKEYSKSQTFRQAYLEDLKEFEKNLKENPDETIGDSDMTYAQAKEYFKHYIEGTDFTDGIDEKDITRTGARENFAESYSTIFDSSPSEVNDIYSDLFGNSVEAVRQFFVA